MVISWPSSSFTIVMRVFDVLDGLGALLLVLGQQVALGQHQGDAAPALQAMLLEEPADVLRVVALRLSADFDGVVARLAQAGDRHFDRFRSHPVVHRDVH